MRPTRFINNNNIDFSVDGPDVVRTTPLDNDFTFVDGPDIVRTNPSENDSIFDDDSRFDCKVVLTDIFSGDLAAKSKLLKAYQDKTHSVLSQKSSEKIFLETLKRKERITWPSSADEESWTKLDHQVTNELLQLPATLSIEKKVSNLESLIYNKASVLFGFVPPPKKRLGGKNRRVHQSISLVINKNKILKELENEVEDSKKAELMIMLEMTRARLRSLRKGEHKRKFRWKRKQANSNFKKNPYLAGKKVLDPRCNVKLSSDKKNYG